MVQHFDCPFCRNADTANSIVDVEIRKVQFKGIRCKNPDCSKYLDFFRDYDETLKGLIDAIDEANSDIEELESELNRLR